MPVYESRIPLPGPGERLFDFITRPANMQLISPPEVQMAFVNAPEVIQLGSRLVFKPAKSATAFGTQAGATREQCRALAVAKLQEAIDAVASSLVAP